MMIPPDTLDFDTMSEQVPISNWIVMEYSSVDLYNEKGLRRVSRKDPNKPKKKREIHPYRLPTREGDWNRRLFVQDGEVNALLEEKWLDCGRYYNIKKMYRNFLQQVYMDTSRKNLHYGRIYQIYNDELNTSVKPNLYTSNKKGFYLSAIVTIDQLRYENKTDVEDNCQMMASLIRKPTRRNTFIFELKEREDFDGWLKYGDVLYIRAAYTHKKTYLRCRNPTTTMFNSHENFPVHLSEIKDRYCVFKVQSEDHTYRDESLPWYIFPRIKLRFFHIETGRYLAAESPKWHQTWFGLELLVSCTKYKTLRGCEKIEHYWRVKTNLGDEDDPPEDPLAAILHLGPPGI